MQKNQFLKGCVKHVFFFFFTMLAVLVVLPERSVQTLLGKFIRSSFLNKVWVWQLSFYYIYIITVKTLLQKLYVNKGRKQVAEHLVICRLQPLSSSCPTDLDGCSALIIHIIIAWGCTPETLQCLNLPLTLKKNIFPSLVVPLLQKCITLCLYVSLLVENVPAELRDPFYCDQYEQEHLKPPVSRLLQSPELYCRTYSLLLGSNGAETQPKDTVALLQLLSQRGVVPKDQDTPLTDADLWHKPIKMVKLWGY